MCSIAALSAEKQYHSKIWGSGSLAKLGVLIKQARRYKGEKKRNSECEKLITLAVTLYK